MDVPFRGRRRFHFKKTGAYMQTLKSEGKSAARLQNRGSSAIAPLVIQLCLCTQLGVNPDHSGCCWLSNKLVLRLAPSRPHRSMCVVLPRRGADVCTGKSFFQPRPVSPCSCRHTWGKRTNSFVSSSIPNFPTCQLCYSYDNLGTSIGYRIPARYLIQRGQARA
jgi:hypothetical protein